MRIKSSHWLALACMLAAALLGAGKAGAGALKKHRTAFAHRVAFGERAAALAQRMLGTPYRWGGSSPSGFDCSGLVTFVYGRLGVKLPHSSYAQFRLGRPVARTALQAGDLVFFDGLGHVGLYAGGGRFIAATHSGDRVRIAQLGDPWHSSRYVGARRLAPKFPRSRD